MRIVRVTAFVLGVVVLSYGSTANADLLNGGFEDGLGDWDAAGEVQAVTFEYPRDWLGLPQPPGPPFYEWRAASGLSFASLWSTGPSAMTQTFTIDREGLALKFDYFYDFGKIHPVPYPDNYDLTTIYDPATIYVEVVDVQGQQQGTRPWTMTINDPVNGTELDEDVNIDWTTVFTDPLMAGKYTLGFEITESGWLGGGPGFESILGVDNVSVVPVPGAVLLGVLGLGSAGGLLRRLRQGSRA